MAFSLVKPLTDAWQKHKEKVTARQNAEALANFNRSIDMVKATRGFFVHDGRKNYWGHAVMSIAPAFETVGGATQEIYKVDIILPRIPRPGDRLVLNQQSGKAGLYLILQDIGRSEFVRDNFDVKLLLIDGDYKGGVGLGGDYTSEYSLGPATRFTPAPSPR